MKNSIKDACTPQPGETIFNTTRHRRCEPEKDQEICRANSVSYLKVQIIFKSRKYAYERKNVCNDKVLKQDNSICCRRREIIDWFCWDLIPRTLDYMQK